VIKRLVGFDDGRDLPNITRGLAKRGYENALGVFADVRGDAALSPTW
jgi:hypothetical protein